MVSRASRGGLCARIFGTKKGPDISVDPFLCAFKYAYRVKVNSFSPLRAAAAV